MTRDEIRLAHATWDEAWNEATRQQQARIDALEAALWLAHEHAKLHRSYDANQNVYETVKAALENTTPQAPLENPGEATPARVVPDAIWNDAIEAAAKINNKHAEKMEREAERAYLNNELDEISAIRSAAWKLQVAGDEIRLLKKGGA